MTRPRLTPGMLVLFAMLAFFLAVYFPLGILLRVAFVNCKADALAWSKPSDRSLLRPGAKVASTMEGLEADVAPLRGTRKLHSQLKEIDT